MSKFGLIKRIFNRQPNTTTNDHETSISEIVERIISYSDRDYSREHVCAKNANLITNFQKWKEPIYRKAINEFGWDGIYITEDAYWNNGHKDDRMSALRWRGDERRDLAEFWKIIHQ